MTKNINSFTFKLVHYVSTSKQLRYFFPSFGPNGKQKDILRNNINIHIIIKKLLNDMYMYVYYVKKKKRKEVTKCLHQMNFIKVISISK